MSIGESALTRSTVFHEAVAETPPAGDGARWFAAYTCPRHEKYVKRQLEERRVEAFLPVYRSVRRWKDRRKEIEFALFPGYVFVRIHERERFRILDLPGVVYLVGFRGKLAPLPDAEIESLRSGLRNGVTAECHPFLQTGRKVRVVRGPVAGMQGILVRKKDKVRVVISLEAIMQSVALEVDAADVEVIH